MLMFKRILMVSALIAATPLISDTAFAGQAMAASKKVEAKRTVYGAAVSPFVRKVRVVLFEKGLDYELKEVLPVKMLNILKQEVPADFAKISPLGKIPAYSEGDFAISDSGVISDYIERIHPQKPLYPADPKLRARAEWFHKYADETVAGVVLQKIFYERVIYPQVLKMETNKPVVEKALKEELPPILDFLEKEIGDKQWIAGDQFSMADIALGTHFVSLKLAGEKIDATKYPKLAAYIDRVHARDSFKKAEAAN